MELKLRRCGLRQPGGDPYNRTILELKRGMKASVKQALLSYNRTILELKHHYNHIGAKATLAYNRTILELKQASVRSNSLTAADLQSHHFGIET